LRSGELADLLGISPDILRHYERMKLLPVPRRSPGNYRLYPRETAHRVRLIRNALAVGFSLPELAKILKVRDAGGARSPNGNELLFGASAGRKFSVRTGWALIVGPEFFGETAVRSSSNGQTGFEGLLTGRLERTGDRPHLRFRMGVGHGIVQHFGAPEWRILAGV